MGASSWMKRTYLHVGKVLIVPVSKAPYVGNINLVCLSHSRRIYLTARAHEAAVPMAGGNQHSSRRYLLLAVSHLQSKHWVLEHDSLAT